MISNEAIVRTSSGSEALEGLTVPEEICDLALACLEGNTSFDDAIRMIVARYSEMPEV